MDEVTVRQGFGGRMRRSIALVPIGLLLVVATIGLLWWNEGRTIDTAKGLAEGREAVVVVGTAKVDPGNDGELVHVQGETATGTPVVDELFGLEANVLSIVRTVEMYQWEEDRDTDSDGDTHYTYDEEWLDEPIDSSRFRRERGHENPPGDFPFDSATVHSEDATMGDFELPGAVIDELEHFRAMPEDWYDGRVEGSAISDRYVYFGDDPSEPEIGDVRVSFAVVQPGPASVIAEQRGSTFAPWATSRDTEVLLVSSGHASADAMFTAAEEANRTTAWVIRMAGLAIMALGFSMVLGPLSMTVSGVPFLRNAVGFVVHVVSTVLALVIGSVVIAVAWLFHRPWLSLALLAGAVLVGFLVWRFVVVPMREKQVARAAAEPPAPDQQSTPMIMREYEPRNPADPERSS